MPVTTDREYRSIDVSALETRAEGDEMIVEGYAATFSQPYTLGRAKGYVYEEQIAPDAFAQADMSDVIMQYDHQGRVFARNRNGTLELSTDEHGLKITARLGGTEIGRQLYEEIRGGYTDRMSFGFTVSADREDREKLDSGETRILRTITGVKKLYDVSAVSLPANDATEISARSLCEGAIARAEAERLAEEDRARRARIIRMLMEDEHAND